MYLSDAEGRIVTLPSHDEEIRRRFDERYEPEPMSGCYLWTGAAKDKGYGLLRVDGIYRRAHRLSWELSRGPIPDGLSVLHRCDTPPCVNPGHLFLGTTSDNSKDMHAKGRQKNWLAGHNSAKTHCPRGHEYTEENTRISRGKRHCRTCERWPIRGGTVHA